ncbi:MAG TPA: 2-C-methyl-D-erythritol 2,4-cyclodiphosphate synthase [Vicinamibacterales bacterium]|jgi:2-C-methyl-D-erythritol 4-phosphate cytidylyltransferase/2-C-methyl-D-erythritol 2,4-cyclodiphosphate synthase
MHVTAIVAAGGRGLRFGGTRPKQLVEIGGRSILERSVALFTGHPAIDEVIVALPQAIVDDPPGYLLGAAKPLRIVVGGARRQDSVANAFRAANAHTDVIVIHDAARPFASADLVGRTIAAAAEAGAALAALQSRDTVKRVERHAGEVLDVEETLVRESIYLAQTPQAFRHDVLRDALALSGDATDEAALAEKAGHVVRVVEGEASNIKITGADDLMVAEAIADARDQRGARNPKPARTGRAGIGYDLHRLVEGRPLILGGVTIPFERGLIGHSDADALSHAIGEAVLGAAAAGNIGSHFPDTDPAWEGASSIDLLRRIGVIIEGEGLQVGNVDATVIAERPRLAPFIEAMRANVARALAIGIDRVSIKGKTNEGIGELGRGEAIAVHAIALLRSR